MSQAIHSSDRSGRPGILGTIKKILSFYKLPLYVMIRPFSGFYAMKYEGQGTMWVALFNFIMVSLSLSFSAQYASIVVNPRHPNMIHSVWDFVAVTTAVTLFCVSNWAVTSLTDGEGRFKDIFMAVCYAMTPIVLTFIPASIFSNILTYDEGAFYHMIISIAIAWFAFLVFAGLVTVHNYTATKAVATVLLTFVALLIILFLTALMSTLWNQLWIFVYSLYFEISFRV